MWLSRIYFAGEAFGELNAGLVTLNAVPQHEQ